MQPVSHFIFNKSNILGHPNYSGVRAQGCATFPFLFPASYLMLERKASLRRFSLVIYLFLSEQIFTTTFHNKNYFSHVAMSFA